MVYEKIKKKFDEIKIEASSEQGYFQDIIEYQHLDGTICRFHLATYKDLGDGWFGIFSEHNGDVLNNKLDTKWIKKISEEYVYFNEGEDL